MRDRKLTNKGSTIGWWLSSMDKGTWAIGLHSNKDELTLYFLCLMLSYIKR